MNTPKNPTAFWWFVNTEKKTVTLHEKFESKTEAGPGYWFEFDFLPAEYQEWIIVENKIF